MAYESAAMYIPIPSRKHHKTLERDRGYNRLIAEKLGLAAVHGDSSRYHLQYHTMPLQVTFVLERVQCQEEQ